MINDRRKGWQYRADRAYQSVTPLRALDAYALRHPVINMLSYVVLAVGLGVCAGFANHSLLIGLVIGVGGGLLAVISTRRNHRRRVANGTSAQYGPPL